TGFAAARFNFIQGGPWNMEDVLPIAHRIAEFGWHVQIYATPPQIADMAGMLQSLPGGILFEHISRIRDPYGADSEAFSTIMDLAEGGKTWVKLSAPYLEPDVLDNESGRFER